MTPKDVVTMRDYVDTRIKALEDRFESIDRSTDLAANTATSIVTQIRAENDAKWTAHLLVTNQLEKRISALETGKVEKGEHSTLDIRIQAIEKANANIQGRFWAFAIGLTVLAIVVSTVIHFI